MATIDLPDEFIPMANGWIGRKQDQLSTHATGAST